MEIREILMLITGAWRTGQPERLVEFFHPEMVIVGPDYRPLARGRDACIASYRDFLASAMVRTYRESAHSIEIWKTTAVATYHWEMDFEQGGRLSREAGTDLFVFERQADRWLAVWRAVTFSPREGG